MAARLTILDESATGETLLELTLHVPVERITVRDLIRQRVRHEVEEYNRRKPETFCGLVQPTESERTLNGYRLKQPRAIDADTQLAKAIDAFAGNQIIMCSVSVDPMPSRISTPKRALKRSKIAAGSASPAEIALRIEDRSKSRCGASAAPCPVAGSLPSCPR